MSISLYFGLPRSGKTTFATSIAVEEAKRIKKGKSKYKAVYTNYPVTFDGVYQIDPTKDLGTYEICDSLILIDEATLYVDSRDHKNFDKRLRAYFFLHGHWRCDIIMFVQQWDSIDKGIRVCTDRVFYVHKGYIRRWISYAMPIPYGIIIPDPKKDDSEKLGEIIQGYCKPNIFVRMFQPRLRRKRYYKYFDSWARPELPPFVDVGWDSQCYEAYKTHFGTQTNETKAVPFSGGVRGSRSDGRRERSELKQEEKSGGDANIAKR